jgi:hypothetical protein
LLPAIPAVPAITATTVSAATTTAAMTAAAPAVTTTTATTATATTALSLRPGFIHHEVSAPEILAIERINCTIRIFVIGNFHESEPTRLTGESVTD